MALPNDVVIYQFDGERGCMVPLLETIANGRPSVLLVHGQPGSGAMWGEVPFMLHKFANVFSYDRPGWGSSSLSATDLSGNTDYLASVVSAIGISSLVLVGYSYGGAVVLDYCSRSNSNPRVVLIAPAANYHALGLLDSVLEIGVFDLFSRPRSRYFKLRRALRLDQTPTGLAIKSLLSESRWIRKDLQALRVPKDLASVVIVAGILDRVVPPTSIRALSQSLGDANVEWFGKLGHTIIWQAPEVIVSVISKFLGNSGSRDAIREQS